MTRREGREERKAAAAREPLTDWHGALERLNVETSEVAEAAFARGESAGARQFLWEPLRAFVAAHREGLSRAVLAGYWMLARSAKLWEAEMRWRERNVERFDHGRVFGVVRREWREVFERLLADGAGGERLSGGRGATRRIPTDHGTLVVRRFRRGGAMRWLGESYFGFRPRPLREFGVLVRARRCGLPVPDAIAAVVERRFGGFAYRGYLWMREISDGTPILEFLEDHPDVDWVPLLASALRRLHDAGLSHPDLNLGNVLVVQRSYGPAVAFVDLDRAELRDRSLGVGARRRSLRRLRRSATKLDPAGSLLSAWALVCLEEKYWQLGTTSGSADTAAASTW